MKRSIAIFLIFLLLFNALGFFGLFVGLRYKTASDLVERLDNNQYMEDETVTIKVPMTIPYHLDSEYERVDGEIEHNGEFYRLVKQKLQKDTLYIVCIKDQDSKRIKQALADYVKTFTDKPVDAKHAGKFLTSFIKDFLPTSIEITPASAGWNHEVSLAGIFDSFSSRSIAVVSPPPQI
ncbi:MAG TPA: hypothetical protein VIU13_12110 [Chryseolinea sp.]